MADIKTREVNKGSIKGIDRAKNLSDRLMYAGVRTKDEVYQIGSREERNETSYDTDSSMDIGRKTVRAGGRSLSDAPRQIRRGIDVRRDAIDVKTKRKMIYRSRKTASEEAVKTQAIKTRQNSMAAQGGAQTQAVKTRQKPPKSQIRRIRPTDPIYDKPADTDGPTYYNF